LNIKKKSELVKVFNIYNNGVDLHLVFLGVPADFHRKGVVHRSGSFGVHVRSRPTSCEKKQDCGQPAIAVFLSIPHSGYFIRASINLIQMTI